MTKCVAVVLAAGSGQRMMSKTKKQYMPLLGKPLLYYSLNAFEKSDIITGVVLVTSSEDIEWVRENIVDKYHFKKVMSIVPGGKERYHSVYEGIKNAPSDTDYIFIHDCARPMIDEDIINRSYKDVLEHKAVVVGMPAKDTVKIADEEGFVKDTPDRKKVWVIQTPQVFDHTLIRSAYEGLIDKEDELLKNNVNITDDAMAVELITGSKVFLSEGSYENIKVTTPDDIAVAEGFLRGRNI